MKEATSLKADGEAAASLLRSRFFAEGFRLNVPATGPSTRYLWDRFPKALVEAAGRSHRDRTWGKWIHFRQADGRKLGMYLEHQGLGRYSF